MDDRQTGLYYKIALCDMVNQFAHECNGDSITTGGLSALEAAFSALDLPDPCKRHELLDKWVVAEECFDALLDECFEKEAPND